MCSYGHFVVKSHENVGKTQAKMCTTQKQGLFAKELSEKDPKSAAQKSQKKPPECVCTMGDAVRQSVAIPQPIA